MKKISFTNQHIRTIIFLFVILLMTASIVEAENFRLPEISMKSYLPTYRDSIPMIIVWDPIGYSNADLLINSIQSMCPDSVYHTDDIMECSLTEQVTAIFCLFGIYPNNYICIDSSASALAIEEYLQNGGSVYIEGGDVWYWDPLYNNGYDFGTLFHIEGISEGTGDLDTVTGLVFLNGMNWTYQGDNNYIGHIEPYPDADLIFKANNNAYGCGIAYNSGVYNTIGTSFQITGLTEPSNSLDDAIQGILNFFNLYTPKGSIRGIVTLDTLSTGNVTNVQVSAGNQIVHPDLWGCYNISIFPGIYDVTASLSGYYPQTIEDVIVIADSTTDNIDFYLQSIPTTEVCGTVICTDGTYPLNTQITLQNDEFSYTTYITDTTGYYTISDVYYGEYTGTAFLDGYFVSYWSGTIDSVNNIIDFTLIPTEPGGEVELHYDSENANSIGGPTSFQCAVRFTPDELEFYYGEYLSKIKFWISSVERLSVRIRVWEGGSLEQGPGTLIYDTYIGDNFNYNDWTVHELNNPIALLENEEYWIGYSLSGCTGFPAGCDDGPMMPDKGAWIYAGTQWMLLPELNPSLNYNWNIRAIIKSNNGGFYLNEDWNWISFNLHPDDTSINSVFASLLPDKILQVKNQTQSATNTSGIFVGNLTDISIGEAYLVKMDTSSIFSINGMPIDYENTPIILVQDWNWIGYLPPVATDLTTALSCIEDNVHQIKNQTQSATWYGVWVGNLTTMEPGTGYKLNMNAPDTLIYQIGKCKYIREEHFEYNPMNWNVMSGTQYNMVVIANIEGEERNAKGVMRDAKSVWRIGVFDDDGNCRSVGIRETVNNKEFLYFTVVGNENGTNLHFKVYDSNSSDIYECTEKFTFMNDITIGSPEEPMSLNIKSSELNLPKIYKLCQNYPNPFNPTTTIKYQLPEETKVKITIYNILGQNVRTLVDTKQNAGYHNIVWNGMDNNNRPLASGIYFYKLQVHNQSFVKKCILLK